MNNRRIANHAIDGMVAQLAPFTNYNGTIEAYVSEGTLYRVRHWDTLILSYDMVNNRIVTLRHDFISQTTSTLVGRLLRNLPSDATRDYVDTVTDKHDNRRLSRMIRVTAWAS